MSIKIKDIVSDKIKGLLKGDKLSRTEIYDKQRISHIMKQYGNKEVIEYTDAELCISEYKDNIQYLVINGKINDEGSNPLECEEHIIIKNGTNVFGYSSAMTNVSYLHLINPNLSNNNILPGKDKLTRERFKLYIGGKKRIYLESFREVGCDKVIYERFNSYDNPTDVKRIDIYYDALDMPIYGEIIGSDTKNSKKSNNSTIIKEMIDLAYRGIKDSVENDVVYRKK